VKPSVFDVLKGHKVYIFNSEQAGVDLGKSWDEYGYNKTALINAGGSVGLGAFTFAMFLGIRDIHIFGLDCHIGEGKYAEGITGNGDIRGVLGLEIEGVMWNTTPSFASFAQQFMMIYKLGKETKQLDTVKLYGKSLIKTLCTLDLEGEPLKEEVAA
jgi:hypothetical protein